MSEKGTRWLGALVSVLAVAGIVVHVLWPGRVDSTSVALFVIALLPWVAPLVKSVELAGVGKIELQEIRAAVRSADHKAEAALANREDDSPSTGRDGHPEAQAEFNRLAAEYNRVRAGDERSPGRTSRMTHIVGRMLRVASRLSSYQVTEGLRNSDPGCRLAAIAYVHEHPRPEFLANLVTTLTESEPTAFGQYWAIQSLKRIIAEAPNGYFTPDVRERLRYFEESLKKDTSRYHELHSLLNPP